MCCMVCGVLTPGKLLQSPKYALAVPPPNMCCMVCGVLTLGKLLPSTKDAVADPLPNMCCLVGGVLLCNCYQEAIADPTWVQSTRATRHFMC